MIPERAAERYPPLPTSVKGPNGDARAIVDVDDARPPGNPVVPRQLARLIHEGNFASVIGRA